MMAVTKQVDVRTVGQMYADLVRDNPAVRRIFVREDEDRIDLWVLTAPIEIDDEEPLYEAGVVLQSEVSDVYVMIRLANPRHFDQGYDLVANVIPDEAVAVPVAA